MTEYVWCTQCNRVHPPDYHLTQSASGIDPKLDALTCDECGWIKNRCDCDSELSAAKRRIVELEHELVELKADRQRLLEDCDALRVAWQTAMKVNEALEAKNQALHARLDGLLKPVEVVKQMFAEITKQGGDAK